jgi:hypothetical protein
MEPLLQGLQRAPFRSLVRILLVNGSNKRIGEQLADGGFLSRGKDFAPANDLFVKAQFDFLSGGSLWQIISRVKRRLDSLTLGPETSHEM